MEFWNLCKEWLTPQTITVITTVIMFLVAILKLISMVKTLNKQKALTMDNLLAALEKQNKDEINKALVEITQPILETVKSIIPYLMTFSKILALSQENTPESRVAILNLLSEMNKTDNDALIEAAKEIIEAQTKAEQEKKEKLIGEMDKIIVKPID